MPDPKDISYLLFFASILPLLSCYVLLHELGHAVTSLLLTRGNVTVLLLSRNPDRRTRSFVIGRLRFEVVPTLVWTNGGCFHDEENTSVYKTIAIIFAGPFLSALLFWLVYDLSVVLNWPENAQEVLYIFFWLALLISTISLIPGKGAVRLPGRPVTYRDGELIRRLVLYTIRYFAVSAHYNNGEYGKAAIGFDRLIQKGYDHAYLYRWAVFSYMQIENYTRAAELYQAMAEKHPITAIDHNIAGLMQVYQQNYEEGLSEFNKATELAPDDVAIAINRGYCLNRLNRYEEAVMDFDRAIALNPEEADAYSNRGFALMQTGHREEGVADIKKALLLDSNHADCHSYLGIYYLATEQYDAALRYFERAYELDNNAYRIDELLHAARTKTPLPPENTDIM